MQFLAVSKVAKSFPKKNSKKLSLTSGLISSVLSGYIGYVAKKNQKLLGVNHVCN